MAKDDPAFSERLAALQGLFWPALAYSLNPNHFKITSS
jgi:hypothetical protein